MDLSSASALVDDRAGKDGRIGAGLTLSEVLSSSYSSNYNSPSPLSPPFSRARSIHLPDALFQEYDLLQSRCFMGLFPELGKAWIVVDYRLFLWDWHKDGNAAFITFEEIKQSITAVGIVTPKKDIFVEAVRHLLVLCTPQAIHLVGVSTTPDMGIFMLDLSLSIDPGTTFISVTSTATGRIFLLASDGCLYEMTYRSTEGLFTRRCSLINWSNGGSGLTSWIGWKSTASDPLVEVMVDNSRSVLYTRSKNSTIEIWHIPASGLHKVATISASEIIRLALVFAPSLGNLLNRTSFEIVGMGITGDPASAVGLVAVTSMGVRLYFSHLPGGSRARYQSAGYASTPCCLDLVHVRPPPTSKPNSDALPTPDTSSFFGNQAMIAQQQAQQPQILFHSIQSVYLSSSSPIFIASNNINPDNDILLLTSTNVGRHAQSALSLQRTPLLETADTMPIEGRTWAIAQSKSSSKANELETQVLGSRAEFLILTNMGMNVVIRNRPVDNLISILEASLTGRDGGNELRSFVEIYGRDQFCSMCLAIASGPPSLTASTKQISTDTVNQAKRAFFEFGGRPRSVALMIGNGGFGNQQMPSSAAVSPDGRFAFSGRHEALAFLVSRLISPIWKSKVTVAAPTPQFPTQQATAVSDAVLVNVQRDLGAVKNFVDAESQLFVSSPERGEGEEAIQAIRAEQDSLNGIRNLLTQAVEAISFILLLIDYRLSEIIGTCSPELSKTLLQLTYQDLLTTQNGRETARKLVSAMINYQIGQQQSIDEVSDILKRRCGSFVANDDVLLYKAIENVRKAKQAVSPSERKTCLRESLRLFLKAAAHLSLDKLKEVVTEYNSSDFADGSIELSLACAKQWDQGNRGLQWWLDGQREGDERSTNWSLRKNCYELALQALESVDNVPESVKGKVALSADERESLRSNAYAKALASDEKAFHFMLYDWHMEQGLTDQLLEIHTETLEEYLQQKPPQLERYDLLWQYYARHFQHLKAAEVLALLADSQDFGLNLNKRLEYLSLAASNARSQFPSSTIRQDAITFLTEVEEKLEVGAVQVQIVRDIHELEDLSQEQKTSLLSRLDDRLFNISELYSEFAEPLVLLETMLLVFHVSDHHDPYMVNSAWQGIVQQVQEESGDNWPEALASRVTSLSRKFFPSDIALPLVPVITLLEKINLDTAQRALSPGWVPISMHEGGVPFDILFAVYDELFRSKVPPWQTSASSSVLLTSLSIILRYWLAELSASGSHESVQSFPANAVDEAIGRYLVGGNTSDDETRKRLLDVQSELRSIF